MAAADRMTNVRPAPPVRLPTLVWVPCWRCGGQKAVWHPVPGGLMALTCTRCEGCGVLLAEVRP